MTASKIQMDQIRSTSATVTDENIRAGSQKKSSLSPAEGLQGASPDATCTCPSGDGSLRHPCPAHPAVEQAGGDERVIGWRERILAAHPNSDPGFWPDALLVEHMAAEIADLRAALAQPSPAQAEGAQVIGCLCGMPMTEGHHSPDGCCNLEEFAPQAQAEKAEVERPEVVSRVVHSNPVVLDQCAPLNANDEMMTVAQHAASVARWAEMFNRVEQERDAALSRVAELELKLDQSDYAYDNDRHHMRGMAKQAAEAIQVFTGHDSGANLAHRYGEKWWEHLDELRDALLAFAKNAPPAQAQHSVPEEFSFEYRHPNGECHTVTVSREQVINEMPDFLFEALCSKFCNCEPVGETNVVECCCDEYAEEFKLIAAAPGKEVGHE
ncbi:hypothetical protein IDX07_08190 [Pseudomonas aeruginosa]|uniref:hypothetical protein n=1 Tax=Pseudomonas aeruginosa TaxID=287 RepID=UPI00167F2CB2|nr:hypothetical protein [Pseudomonas aeruginosa]MBD1243290.1 hypothetical protein [Pseudomonas aeruginosa]